MAIELAPGVSYCTLGDTAIFLDLTRDRYSAIARCALDGNSPMSALFRKGLLVGTGRFGSSVRPLVVAKPTREVATSSVKASMIAQWSALWMMIRTVGRLRRVGLAASIHYSSRSPGRQGLREISISGYQYALRSFETVDRVFDQTRSCLTRSLAMKETLRRASLDATLVIGVKLYPFEAHAWLQTGDIVVNDSLDRVVHYQPVACF